MHSAMDYKGRTEEESEAAANYWARHQNGARACECDATQLLILVETAANASMCSTLLGEVLRFLARSCFYDDCATTGRRELWRSLASRSQRADFENARSAQGRRPAARGLAQSLSGALVLLAHAVHLALT